jgi:hypothetical protein
MNANEPETFIPLRTRGLMFHILVVVFLLVGCAGCLILSIQQEAGGLFALFLIFSLIFFAPVPVFIYRAYALYNAYYQLSRDGLRIRWGLRSEDIPLPEIEWVRPASELGFRLPLPRITWPGAIRGTRQVPELGPVEFLASNTSTLIVVAARDKVYAISPDDPRGFLRAFQYAIEMGTLNPLKAASARPAAYARRVWDDRPARISLIAGLILTLILFIQVSLIVPSRASISLGFDARGVPQPPVPSRQLMLLPVLGIFAYMVDLISGMYFYHRLEHKPVAFLLWISSAFTPLILILATFFLL